MSNRLKSSSDAVHSGSVNVSPLVQDGIRIACRQLLSSTCSKEEMLVNAGSIVEDASFLANIYKTAYLKILNPVVRNSFVESVNYFMTASEDVYHKIKTLQASTGRNLLNIPVLVLPVLQALNKLAELSKENIEMTNKVRRAGAEAPNRKAFETPRLTAPPHEIVTSVGESASTAQSPDITILTQGPITSQSTNQRNPNPTSNSIQLPDLRNSYPFTTSHVFLSPTLQQSSQSSVPSASTPSGFQRSQTGRPTGSDLEAINEVEVIAEVKSQSTNWRNPNPTSNSIQLPDLRNSYPFTTSHVFPSPTLQQSSQSSVPSASTPSGFQRSQIGRPTGSDLEAINEVEVLAEVKAKSGPAVSPSVNVNIPTQSHLIQEASKIFNEALVVKVVQLHLEKFTHGFATVEELCKAVLKYKGMEGVALGKNPPDNSRAHKNGNLNSHKDSSLCKICLEEDIGVMFQPCGHVFSCRSCAKKFKQCPMCRQRIKKNLRAYLS